MAFFNSKEVEILRKENLELKKQLSTFTENWEICNNTEEVLKKLRIEIADLNEQKEDLKDEVQILVNDKNIKESELNDLSNKIPELNGYKNELQQNLLDYTSQIEILKKEIEKSTKIYGSGKPASDEEILRNWELLEKENLDLKDKIERLEKLVKTDTHEKVKNEEKILEDLREREIRILRGIENKKSEASLLIKKVESLKLRDAEERNSLKNIYKEIETKKREKEYYSKEEIRILNSLARLKEKEEKLSEEILEKEQVTKTQDEILNMLTKNIAHKQEKDIELDKDLRELDKELREKSDLISRASGDYNKIVEERSVSQKSLHDVNNELDFKAEKLRMFNDELMILEKRLSELEKEIEKSEAVKKELAQKVNDQLEIYEKLKEQTDLLRETFPLLEKKKADIEKENTALEERFGKLFQKYSKDVNELSKKRIMYEKLVMDKEKEVNEKDQQLFEKIAALEESERVLGLRNAEINSLQDTLKLLDAQKDTLRKDLNSLENKTTEVLRRNDGLRMETEYLMSKKQSIEDNMREILTDMNERFEKSRSKKHEIDEEIAEYEDRLHITRERISESIKEMSELQTSVGQLKLEHEEQRGFITRLVAKKTKLLEDISRSQVLFLKYEQIKEKVKIEKAVATGKKEGGIFPGEVYINETKSNPDGEQLEK